MHRVDCHNDQHMHNVVGVQIEVDQTRKPLFRYAHSTYGASQNRNTILQQTGKNVRVSKRVSNVRELAILK